MMISKTFGKAEHDLIQFVSEHGPITARAIHEQFGVPRNYTRGTVVKMLDRLIKKGFLRRQLNEAVFNYTASQTNEELERDLVKRFVEHRLGGSLTPIMSFLVEPGNVGKDDVKRLDEVVAKLKK